MNNSSVLVGLQRGVRLHLLELPDLVLPRHGIAHVRGEQPLAEGAHRGHPLLVRPQRRLALRLTPGPLFTGAPSLAST